MTSQSSDDPDDVTLGEEDQEELRDTLTGHGLAPTAQDPDEDKAYTPTQDEERSWQTFEHYTGSHLRQTHSHRCRGSVYRIPPHPSTYFLQVMGPEGSAAY